MKRYLGALGSSFVFAIAMCVPAMAETQEKLHREFPFEPGGNLLVDVDFGGIEIATNHSGKIIVDVERNVVRRSKADEERFLKERPVVIQTNGNTLSITSRGPKSDSNWSLSGRQRNEAKYVVQVPAAFSVDLKTAGGSVRVKGLNGPVVARTSGGGLEFNSIKGKVDGKTSGGGIQASGCDGEMTIRTSGGGVHVRDGVGKLDAKTSGGGMEAKNFTGPVKLQTSGGGIEVEQVAGTLEAETSGGTIRAELDAVTEIVKLQTSAGSIRLTVPRDARFNIEASTSAGRVQCELPVTSTANSFDSNRLIGTVNGGGKMVLLRTSAGSIHVDVK